MEGTAEIMDLVNALILADIRVTTNEIFEQLGISVSSAHKIVHYKIA